MNLGNGKGSMSTANSSGAWKSADSITDQFPAGLRVLAVDDDPTCLLILEKMLRNCLYKVTKCNMAETALSLLRENKKGFDIVISDVHMPDMDGFKLLKHIGLEMDLPVIMMSADDGKSVVMKGVTHGACDYLIKPVRIEALKNIWQHVVRKRKNDWIASPIFDRLQIRWEQDEQHKKFSERGKKNRSSDCEGKRQPKHILGRKNLVVKKMELVVTLTREPTSIELFQESHKRRDGSFIDERTTKINTELEVALEKAKRKLREEEKGDDALSTHEEQDRLYLDIVGSFRRDYVYGMDNQSQALLRRASFSAQDSYSSFLHDPFGIDLNYRTLMQRHVQELSVGFNIMRQQAIDDRLDRKKSEKIMKRKFNKLEKMMKTLISTLGSRKNKSSKRIKGKTSQVLQEEDVDDDEVQDNDYDDDDDDDDDEEDN